MMNSLTGQSLDRYQIRSLHAEGGMGTIYRGYDPRLDREVAVKVMHPHYARRPDFQERFLLEARTAARLDHPCIVKVHDSGISNEVLYIVMEFIPGDNLRSMLNKLRQENQWILINEAAHLVRQICLAIDYAHRQGVLYRDIKPDNIMIKDEPSGEIPFRPVLTDLGLAKLLEGIPITQDGESLGTPAYMSPEQALGNETDVRSDIYSLGILLYELVVGRLPFEVKSLADAIRSHTKEPPPSPRFLRPGLPAMLEDVILQALQKDPSRRFPSAAIMAASIGKAVPDRAAEKTLIPEPEQEPEVKSTSLLTQYRSSLGDTWGPSIVQSFPVPPTDLAYDRLQILSKERTIRTVLVKGTVLTVGRGEDNDIILEDQNVSREHARIEFDGSDYRVVDLKSTNGVFQDGAKLLPGVPEVWAVGKTLKIGDHWLRMERSPRSYVRTLEKESEEPGTTTQVQSILASECLTLLPEVTNLSVEPGNSVTANLTVANEGQTTEKLQITLLGVPTDWLDDPAKTIRLRPGEQQRVCFAIHPPRLPDTRPGSHTLKFQAASMEVPGNPAEAYVTLQIAPFSLLNVRMEPRSATGEREANFLIFIKNVGSAPLQVHLDASPRQNMADNPIASGHMAGGADADTVADEAGTFDSTCYFTFDRPELMVSPGEERQVRLLARAERLPPAGELLIYPFVVSVRPEGNEARTVQINAKFECKPAVKGVVPKPAEARRAEPVRIQSPSTPSPFVWKEDGVQEEEVPKSEEGVSRFVFGVLVLLLTWLLAPILAERIVWGFACIECIKEFAYSISMDGFIIQQIPWTLPFILAGSLLGVGMWLALRVAESTLPFKYLLLFIAGWTVAQIMIVIYMLGIIRGGYSLANLIHGFYGTIGGMTIAWALQKTKNPPRFGSLLTIILAWSLLSWLRFRLWSLNLWAPPDSPYLRNFIETFLTVLIAGGWTMFQIRFAQRRSLPKS